jgi:CBS-domain-containing membrane protein
MGNPTFTKAIERALAGGAGIGVMIAMADATGYPLVALPFATSIVMVMGSPEIPAAQPARVLGGHLVCAAAAIACTMVLGFDAWVAAVAIMLSMLVMQALDVFHPPAGITPMIVVTSKAGPLFLLCPVLAGAIMLIAFSALFKSLTTHTKPDL